VAGQLNGQPDLLHVGRQLGHGPEVGFEPTAVAVGECPLEVVGDELHRLLTTRCPLRRSDSTGYPFPILASSIFAQLGAATVEEDALIAHADLEHRAGLIVRESLNVTQKDNQALSRVAGPPGPI